MADSSYVVVVDKLPEIIAQMHEAVSTIVADTAKKIASEYAANAPVRTGFMASSAYSVTKDGSTYAQGVAEGAPGATLLPEVAKPANDLEAVAAVAADYAAYVEYGTYKMAAQPKFLPAVETAEQAFKHDLEDLQSKVKG